ncbi:MAG: LysR family transcriptional regulator [Bdellovibrionales bacterium]
MKTMSYDLLETLIAVAESKNFREAAEKLQLSQPGVTHKIKELEALHPVPIFQFEGKRKVLTHFGRALYEAAKEQIAVLGQKIETLHRSYGSAKDITVRVGGRLEVLEFVVPHLKFPGRFELVNLSANMAVESLLNHKVDIAISYVIPDSTEIIAKKLFQSSAHIAIHKNLLKGQSLNKALSENLKFLTTTPSIFYQRDGHILKEWIGHLGAKMSDLNCRYIAEDWRAVGEFVERKLGYAVMPAYVRTGPDIARLELPERVLKKFQFYALFERGLNKIESFKPLLSFTDLKF